VPKLRVASLVAALIVPTIGRAQAIPSVNDIVLSIRDGASPGTRVVYVDNRSRTTIVITSLRLLDCENVQGGCVNIRLRQPVPAGAEVQLRRIRARFEDEGFAFRVTFSWELEKSEAARPAVTAAPEPVAVPVAPTPAPPSAPEPVSPANPPPQRGAALVADSAGNTGVYKVAAEAVKADAPVDAALVDSIQVLPATGLALRVGQVLDLRQTLTIRALNAAKQVISGVQVRIRIEVGPNVVRLERGTLTGIMPGTAVLFFAPASPAGGQGGNPKGASRLMVRVTER
jgi:hypothetical protein